jgi:AraC family transcriptional regulator, regulatory protein of adaptative response / methylated-DNA-[protein]-cysteine methyltransferase
MPNPHLDHLVAVSSTTTAAHKVTADERLVAVRARDVNSDGAFVYAVRTTGVYCKPSCASRPARVEHIEFFGTPALAEHAGYRACKRCKPNEPERSSAELATLVTELCRAIESSDTPPSLEELAAQSGLSASHLHRVFKAATGVTPKNYVDAQRKQRLQRELDSGATVTSAIYGSGFNSSGRFYEQADNLLGMTPVTYKRGGQGMVIRFAVAQCSLGAVLVAATERGVCAIALGEDAEKLTRDLQRQFPKAEFVGADPTFDALVAEVIGLVEHPARPVALPLDVRGSAFQCRVWTALRRIPVGKTVSYAELAQQLGAPKAVRAVAKACATNAVAVVIPCHRVVRTDGGISGYRWGVERKKALLLAEAQTNAQTENG